MVYSGNKGLTLPKTTRISYYVHVGTFKVLTFNLPPPSGLIPSDSEKKKLKI